MQISIKKINKNDLAWIKNIFIENWGSDFIVSHGKIYKPENLEGFVAEENGEKVGLVTVFIENNELEIVSINSSKPNVGIGAVLLKETINFAKSKKLKRVWLMITNDNLNALKFYQKNEFHLVKIYPNALIESRKIKPQIPEIGENGILLRDEIELEINL